MIDQLYSSTNDLKIAESTIKKMSDTTNFTEMQELWQNYLMRIERSWDHAVSILQKKKGFQQWFKPYAVLKKKDSLLVYLKQARNAEMHNVDTTINKSLKLMIKEKTGRNFRLDSIKSNISNGILDIDLESPDILLDMEADIIPTDPEVVRFKCSGNWYNPPWNHLGNRIEDLHPVSLALIGLNFYKAFLSEAGNFLE